VVFFGAPTGPATGDALVVTSNTPAPITGAPAPDFTLTTSNGKQIALSSLKGQPVLINFWATWCGPCKTEMPAIQAAYQKHQADKLQVLAVDAGEEQKDVSAFGSSLNLTFDLLMDPGNSVNDLYQVRAYPSTFFVGTDGKVAALQIGSMTDAQLSEGLAKILPK
jgi:peroxiredoxin